MLILNPKDTVAVNEETGHKVARRPIQKGEAVYKYGEVIGRATQEIPEGEWVHSHNLKTDLERGAEYHYQPVECELPPVTDGGTFMGYRRKNGDVGIRNEIWIVNTVGCVNKIARKLAALTGAVHFEHPYGCPQLGEDHATTQLILKGLVNHPNAAGVLVLGLGCENNNIEEFKKVLGTWDEERVRFLNAQDAEDEIAAGVAIIEELQTYAAQFEREPIPFGELKVGLKCGGSDGFSGITANPLVGAFTDRLCGAGGVALMSEVPEMFGAEHLLMNRCPNEELFEKTKALVQDFKAYFGRFGQPCYENPSPGNKAGGITTLEEKSLGCIKKGGSGPVAAVLTYGEIAEKPGLNLINGPGNDLVAITNLTAAGAHLILFTTGRGTPVGGPVPTMKLSTNRSLATRKGNWIDFDASPLLEGVPMEQLERELEKLILEVASGKAACNELNECREIAIFKDGITE